MPELSAIQNLLTLVVTTQKTSLSARLSVLISLLSSSLPSAKPSSKPARRALRQATPSSTLDQYQKTEQLTLQTLQPTLLPLLLDMLSTRLWLEPISKSQNHSWTQKLTSIKTFIKVSWQASLKDEAQSPKLKPKEIFSASEPMCHSERCSDTLWNSEDSPQVKDSSQWNTKSTLPCPHKTQRSLWKSISRREEIKRPDCFIVYIP